VGCKKKIQIGDNTAIGPNVLIFDHNHDYLSDDFRNNYICDDIIIGNNVWIGGGAIILAGSKIGDNSVIAAGTIVNTTIPSNTVYYNKRTGISKQIINK
jgi:acetyltransferase-like isoleucine patch superfamily enzyme